MWKVLVVLALLAGGGYAAWRYLPLKTTQAAMQKKDEAPRTALVKKGDLRVVVQASGRVVPNREVEIKCKASGEVVQLPVDVSDTVKKEQLLVQLDPIDEERTVKQATVKLAVSQARLEQAKLQLQIAERDLKTERIRAEAALKSAQARLDETNRKLERDKAMLESGAASQEDYDRSLSSQIQASAAFDLARARFEELKTQEVALQDRRQAILIAEQTVESDKIALADAQQRLKETTVLSPIDAIVADRKVQEGQIIASGVSNVGGGTTVMTLADLSRIFVLVAVDQSDIGKVEPGQSAQITVDAHPDAVFPAKVVRVAPKGVNSQNVVTYEVKVEVLGPRRNLLKPEMVASVSITAVDRTDVLLVPASAVERRRRDRIVTVLQAEAMAEDARKEAAKTAPKTGEERKGEERTIEVGATDGEYFEVLSGLSEGEIVQLKASAGQSRWQRGGSEADKARQQERMKMRMMGGLMKR